MKFIDRLIYSLTGSILRARGFSGFGLKFMRNHISRELLHYEQLPLRKRLWALRRGFLPDKVRLFGLTEDNYRNYISDYDYSWLHPISGEYTFWLEDKVTFLYLLQPFSDYLPEYYCQITPRGILRLADAPEGFETNVDGVINLLKVKGELAAKYAFGGSGFGFYKLGYSEGNYYLSEKISSEESIRKLIQGWIRNRTEYVITEYLHPHPEIARIWGKTPNALRVTIVRGMDGVARIAYAYTRFGTSSTGMVDNISSGGVFNLIDLETGLFSNGKRGHQGKIIDFPNHPDSGTLLAGTIPYWSLIKEKLIEMSDYLPQLRILGFDVAVVKEGFKIVEINHMPTMDTIQTFTPVYKHEILSSFFLDLLKEDRIVRAKKKRHVLKSIFRRAFISPNSITEKLLWRLKKKFRQEDLAQLLTLIRDSGYFNEQWYLEKYPEVREAGIEPLQHYLTQGGFEGRNPGPEFDSVHYLENNADVRRQGINPLVHYLLHGRLEGRTPVRKS